MIHWVGSFCDKTGCGRVVSRRDDQTHVHPKETVGPGLGAISFVTCPICASRVAVELKEKIPPEDRRKLLDIANPFGS